MTSCGGEKAENKTDKKEETKTETPEKKPEAPEKAEEKPTSSEKKDLASQLIGKWEITQSFDPSGAEDGTKGTLTFTEKGFTRTTKYASDPNSQTVKGTWSLDPSKKTEQEAINCIMFKDEAGSEVPENVMPIENNVLTLMIAAGEGGKIVYKRK